VLIALFIVSHCVAMVTAAAVRVAERRNHTLSSFKLSTVLVATWPHSASCAVSVTGFAKDMQAEPIVWFFENQRRSGGGPVMELYYDEQKALAVVTFYDRQGEFLVCFFLVIQQFPTTLIVQLEQQSVQCVLVFMCLSGL